jgi:hypothetical protein
MTGIVSPPELNIPLNLLGETNSNTNVYSSLGITSLIEGFYRLGGRGADDLLSCMDSTGKLNPRCPKYDVFVTGNEGVSFQTGSSSFSFFA